MRMNFFIKSILSNENIQEKEGKEEEKKVQQNKYATVIIFIH